MSTNQVAAPAAQNQLSVLGPKLAALDQFAEENNLAILTEGKGSFTAALSVADAIGRLKEMLTAEIMTPIMKLQGTSLGFKTDKDREGGYPLEVVRDCFIEATLRGFKMVGNQTNIIGARAYQTKEGFEDWFMRKGREGKFTDYRESYTIPKIITEQEAHVTVSATWKWNGTADKMENVALAIRINKGQGADAILGKAKRKLLAKIYSRVTGTTITEGDANEAPTIDVETRPVAESGATGTPAGQPAANPKGATEDQKAQLFDILEPHAALANKWLLANNGIPAGGTYIDVGFKTAERILKDSKKFLATIGAPV